ncbi:broad substrate specificity ATP-binding cassette transporter ABCG2-like [Urocitellus parryii]
MLGLLGILLTFTPLPPWLSWLEYFSNPHYGYLALQHNEFLGRNYCPELNTTEISSCSNYVICTGEEFLTNQGIDLSPWSLWKNHVALAFMMIIFLTIAYLKLLFLKRSSAKPFAFCPRPDLWSQTSGHRRPLAFWPSNLSLLRRSSIQAASYQYSS